MAIGFRMCVCGHEETVRGKGVRRGQNSASPSPCQKCAYLLGAIQGKYKGPHRPTPFDRLVDLGPRESICEGTEFSYTLDDMTVHCRIVAVERGGGEVLGISAPAYSVGGKTEHEPALVLRADKSPLYGDESDEEWQVLVEGYAAALAKRFGQFRVYVSYTRAEIKIFQRE